MTRLLPVFSALILMLLTSLDSIGQLNHTSEPSKVRYGNDYINRGEIIFGSNTDHIYSFTIRRKTGRKSTFYKDVGGHYILVPKKEFGILDSIIRVSISDLFKKGTMIANTESTPGTYKAIFYISFKAKPHFIHIELPSASETVNLVETVETGIKTVSGLSHSTKDLLINMMTDVKYSAKRGL